jgi:DtxR family Mn-dependent transcriptional regulator
MAEDALKHLYDCEYKKLVGTRQSISGALWISAEKAAKLLARLEASGLVQSLGEGSALTDEGRSYALRIIRVHRLWEQHLAHETGLRETEWHAEAERQEHRMTPRDADQLAAQMGNPGFDPHGDPIPTSSGDLPARKGLLLNQLVAGEFGEVVHVEDEPSAVYAQLVALGLNPGVRVRMTSVSKERVCFEADGVENVLAPIVATNVTVLPLAPENLLEGPFDTLASLSPGEKGAVLGISRACRGQQRRRLMDLGVIPGTVISAEMKSASGDPTAYSIRGATIALRAKQARMVHVRRVEEQVT